MAAEITSIPARELAAQDSRNFQVLFLMSFVCVLFIVLAAQLLFLDWRAWLPGAEGEKSLIKGVRSGVYSFMSHLQ